jgi:hypothetical protein
VNVRNYQRLLGGKSVVFIRYNPDKILNNKKPIIVDTETRLKLLVKIIKEELIKNYDNFIVKLIQLYYDDNYKIYKPNKIEDITKYVAIKIALLVIISLLEHFNYFYQN